MTALISRDESPAATMSPTRRTRSAIYDEESKTLHVPVIQVIGESTDQEAVERYVDAIREGFPFDFETVETF